MNLQDTAPVGIADGRMNRYGNSTRAARSLLEGISVADHRLAARTGTVLVVLGGPVVLVAIGALGAVSDPPIDLLAAGSALPTLLLAASALPGNVTAEEPLTPVAATANTRASTREPRARAGRLPRTPHSTARTTLVRPLGWMTGP